MLAKASATHVPTTPTTSAHPARFTTEELARIPAETFIARVDYREEIPSTNSRALELTDGQIGSVLVLADRQTAGRGRGGNAWWSADGALTFSVRLRASEFVVPEYRWPQLSLAAGLAVCEALEATLPVVTARIKWPNDVYVADRKVCGILVEAARFPAPTVVIGIGVNVNNSTTAAPPELRQRATALCDIAQSPVSRCDLLVSILRHLATRLAWLSDGAEDLQSTWSRRCLLTGRDVEIEQPAKKVIGRCRGIDADGALLVETSAGVERCLAGVVARFE